METNERIASLEAEIKDLQIKHDVLNKQLTDAQVEQWQARIDNLEVQIYLGAKQVSDKVAPLMDRLRTTWLQVTTQVDDKSETASHVADTLLNGLENAYSELRKAVLESRSTVSA
ncbi:MAG: hypothetical protein ABIN55_14520 [Aeromicrobium sp.]